MTKKKIETKGMTKLQKLFIAGAVILSATGLYLNHAKAADLLYSTPPKHVSADYLGNDWYVAGRVSGNFVDDYGPAQFDTGFGGSLAFGTNLGGLGFADFRGELEAGYFQADVDNIVAPFSVETDTLFSFANFYADFDTGTPFKPFIGAGVGYARTRAELSTGFGSIEQSDDNLAWNATAGLSYDLTKDVSVDVAYRFIQLNDVTVGPLSDNVDIHQVNAGLRLKL